MRYNPHRRLGVFEMNSFMKAMLLAAVAISLLGATPAGAAGFTNANLKGGYSMLVAADNAASPFTQIGVLTFNGVSAVSFTWTANNNGSIFSGSESGTYSVKANGSGSISMTGLHSADHFTFVLNSVVNGVAKGLHVVATSGPNLVIYGTATHQ
jgi:hypothetical protein